MKSWTRAMPALLLTLAGACGEGGPAATAAPDLRRTPAGGDQRIEGSFGPGALYALFKPANWNGELITYAHGFIDPCGQAALLPRHNGVMSHSTSASTSSRATRSLASAAIRRFSSDSLASETSIPSRLSVDRNAAAECG